MTFGKNIHHVSGQLGVVDKCFNIVGSKVKSVSDGHGNLASSIANEPMKGFEQKLTKIHTVVGRRTVYVFKVIGSKVKVAATFASGGIQINGSLLKTILLLRTYISL